ncbi:MAG: divalent-cation tolerance protein CutA [Patescibacteria group bacterium]
MIILYSPFPSKEKADRVGKLLLEKKLVACVNLLPANSFFWWKNEIQSEDEIILLAKTTDFRVEDTRDLIEKEHPYETPCVISISCKANDKYLNWLEQQVR